NERGRAAMLACGKHLFQRLQPVSLARRLVPAQAADAGKAHGETGFVPHRELQTLECDFQHKAFLRAVLDLAHGAESLDSVAAYEAVDLDQFLVGETEIGFADR